MSEHDHETHEDRLEQPEQVNPTVPQEQPLSDSETAENSSVPAMLETDVPNPPKTLSDKIRQAFSTYKTEKILGCILGVFLLIGAVAWMVTNSSAGTKPISANNGWSYPIESCIQSLTIDDFELSLNGSILLKSNISDTNGGLTKPYLEDCVTFDPPTDFTVEQVDARAFRIYPKGGKALPSTAVIIDTHGSTERFRKNISAHFAVRTQAQAGQMDAPITLVFSDLIDAEKAKPYISISPAFAFDISGKDNFLTITPKGTLDYSAAYQITVSNQLESSNGLRMQQDAVIIYNTEPRSFLLHMTNQKANVFHPDDPVVLEYLLDQVQPLEEGESPDSEQAPIPEGNILLNITAELYAFPDFDTFYRQLGEPTDGQRDLSAFAKPLEIREVTLQSGLNAVSFENPGAGYYLVRTIARDGRKDEAVVQYKPFQVSSAALYMQSLNGQSLLWLNDTASGTSLANHTIVFEQNGKTAARAVTAQDGTAVTSYVMPVTTETIPETNREVLVFPDAPLLFTVYDPAGVPIYADRTDTLTEAAYSKSGDQNRYYSFFYLDRALYRPTDTIEFWGYLKPYRLNKHPAPTTATVTFDPGGLNQKVIVDIRPDGTYQGKLTLDKLVSSQYGVYVDIPITAAEAATYPLDYNTNEPIEKRTIDNKWIDVKEFEKPVYLITSSTDKQLYKNGEQVTVTIQPTFYDGTPLPNYPLEFSQFNPYSGDYEGVQNITTDANGTAVVTINAGGVKKMDPLSWKPTAEYYHVKIANDGENIAHQGTYHYLPGDVMLRPSLAFTADGNLTMTVLANYITLEHLTDDAQISELLAGYYSNEDSKVYDVLKGAPADINLTAQFAFNYIEPVDSDWRDHNMQRTIAVKNGRAVVEKLIDVAYLKDRYFYAQTTVGYQSGSDRVEASVSQSNGKPSWYEEGTQQLATKGYTFHVYKNAEVQPAQAFESYFNRSYLQAETGDQLRFQLYKDGVAVNNPDGTLLYTILQDEIIDKGFAVNSFTLTQNPLYANNILVCAAYFDGTDVYPIQNCSVEMSRDSLALSIETTTDRETYLPGETVTVKAKVTDRKGNPVQGPLCISIVDESIFALREQYIYLLSDLYNNVQFYNYYIYRYTSTTGDIPTLVSGGEGGKGDGDNLSTFDKLRKNFKDTAYFYAAASDAQGNATVSFTLPDNITSWRITSISIGDNLFGGYSRSNFITTLPFFVKPVISSKYIAGDEIAVLIQGHGTALDESAVIDYKVRIQGDGLDETFDAQGKAYQPVTVNFGKLPEGEYTVTSYGAFDALEDAVELPLAVISSNLELVVNSEIDLQKPLKIDALRYPVVITLYDEAYRDYYDSISSLLTHYCFRIDQRMSRFAAKRALMQHSDPETLPQHIRVGNDDASEVQNDDGGIGWYMGDESDSIITLKVMLFAGDQFSLDRMKRYFITVTEDSTKTTLQQAAAHAGIAAIDNSHTQEIHKLLARSTNMPLEEKLYYLIGLAYGGDTAGAHKLYSELVTPLLKSRSDQLFLEYSNDGKTSFERDEKNDAAAAAAWITASKLKLEDADGFARYFAKSNWRISSLFECMIYVTNYDKPVSDPAVFRYTANGTQHTINLGVTGRKSITFNRSEMKDLKFENVPDSVHATAYYIGEPSEVDIKPSDTISIKKEITPMEGGRYKNTITINFEDAAAYGYYNISDWVPSNMRLHTVSKNTNANMWIQHEQENQKLYFEFYRSKNTPSVVRIEYFTQKTYDVEAVVDRTYIVCADSGENAFSERSTIR